jgi:hypothetical protein
MAKRKVTVRVEEAKNAIVTAAGGTITDNVQPGVPLGSEGGDVEMDLKKLEGGTYTATGGDLVRFTQIAEPLQELADLIAQNLRQQDQIDHLQELVGDLKAQAEKPPGARNASKIRMLLDNVGTYLGLASLAATQAEKAQKLFETVRGLLTGA